MVMFCDTGMLCFVVGRSLHAMVRW